MKRRYIKRKITCKDIIRRVAALAGLDPKSLHDGYFSRKGWTELLLKLENLNARIKEFEDETGIVQQ